MLLLFFMLSFYSFYSYSASVEVIYLNPGACTYVHNKKICAVKVVHNIEVEGVKIPVYGYNPYMINENSGYTVEKVDENGKKVYYRIFPR